MPRLLLTPLSLLLLVALACSSSDGDGSPTAPDPDPTPSAVVFEVRGGAEFTIRNRGASDYLFSWTDGTGTYTDIEDPTLILDAGATYVFRRASSAHPFRITNASLGVTGTDGSFRRTTSTVEGLDSASLAPIADFTADPAPTSDQITWTPGASEIGTYFYTCTVLSHTGMTGQIRVR